MKLIFTVSATVLAGLLILLSLYPIKIVIHPCNYWGSAESSFRVLYNFTASIAFVLFGLSATANVFFLFIRGNTSDYLLLRTSRMPVSTYQIVSALTYMGFVALTALGVSMSYAIYAGLNLDGNYFCYVKEALLISDALSAN